MYRLGIGEKIIAEDESVIVGRDADGITITAKREVDIVGIPDGLRIKSQDADFEITISLKNRFTFLSKFPAIFCRLLPGQMPERV